MKNFVFTKIVFLVIFTISLLSQPKSRREGHKALHTPINIEIHNSSQTDSTFICFVSYKVSFNNLLFVKEEGNYVAGFTLSIVVKKDGTQIERLIKTTSTVVNDYDETLRNDIFIEDLMQIELGEGEYIFHPNFSILNTDFELPMPPVEVLIDTKQILEPIIVYNKINELEGNSHYRIVNQKNSIPYSIEEYDVLIPVYENSVNSLDLIVEQKGEKIIETTINQFEELSINFVEQDNQIILKNNPKLKSAKLFKYSAINRKLNEGSSKIKVSYGSEEIEFNLHVFWDDKPKSLRNPESAIELLKIIDKKDEADSLLDFDEEEYYKVLYNYWKKYDRDLETGYNEVFAEFYSRVDKANENFKSMSGDSGAESDRGVVFIKYGKPDLIDRTYNEQYNIIEIWKYTSINKKVIFADHTGTGNFVRIK